ncbi:Hemicentin-1 [Toxocara canis]|uniref:Hemicentin-1 n=1 Tax=Toxocara canis TaxID=6265 RepID=A0A0B2VJY0_TOXCA|nr:Hemicentin-1 [Toxocara canis]
MQCMHRRPHRYMRQSVAHKSSHVLRVTALLVALCFTAIRAENRIFKLPRLILHADQYYLVRRQEVDLSCQIEPGWRGATMADVEWMKDGVLIDEIDNSNIREELVADGPTLRILNGRHHAEGDYQCSAVVRGVRISNGQHVDTRLVSAPVKFRRARITKFDKLLPETITVFQGQIARLPCSGMPDVIPGPPELWFEKEGIDKPLGLQGDQRYLATLSGMQMPLAKASDSGSYYCVVRNVFTNQTRKSPHAVRLEVLPKRQTMLEPVLVYPLTISSPSSPIVFDVVKGQTVLLECIISSAKIVWTKLNSSNSGISLTNDQARFRQIWGNLRIRQVNDADNGIYVCESSPVFSQGEVDGYPKIFYKLQVHSPTDVQLMLGQLDADKSWQIPMVYMNGLALIDAMDQLGVPPHTNFYTNPINATLTSSVALSGSVQCMSRPAMDEAEVYGNGLERGRAMNLYVDNRLHRQINLISQGPENSTRSIGDTVQLVCLVVPRTTRTLWLKDDKRVPLIGKKRVRLVGTASLQITDIQPEDEGWYTCEAADNTNHKTRSSAYLKVLSKEEPVLTTDSEAKHENDFVDLPDEQIPPSFEADGQEIPSAATLAPLVIDVPRAFVTGRSIRVQWSLPEKHPDSRRVVSFKIELRTENANNEWIVGDQLEGHVRATTVRGLMPGNRYQFRVMAILMDRSKVTSRATDWLTIEQTDHGVTLPSEPQVKKISAESDTTLRLTWTHSSIAAIDAPDKFIVAYGKSNSDRTLLLEMNGTVNELLIRDLEPSTEYKATVTAENRAGRSQPSQPAYGRTNGRPAVTAARDNSTGLFALLGHSLMRLSSSWDMETVAIGVAAALLALVALLACCLACCTIRQRHAKKITKAAKGKFVDTSHRIFNEQRVQKTRFYHDPMAMSVALDDVDEYSPLKSSRNDDRPPSVGSLKSFPFGRDTVMMPNLYGDSEDYCEDDHVAHTADELTRRHHITGYTDTSSRNPAPAVDGCIHGSISSQCYSPQEMTRESGCSPRRPFKMSDPLSESLICTPAANSPLGDDCCSNIGGMLSSGSMTTRPASQSPITESLEDECLRVDGSSRNSQISSNDGRFLQTFRSNTINTTSFISGTFERKRCRESDSHETTPIATVSNPDFALNAPNSCPSAN